jgi:hypothetical protein
MVKPGEKSIVIWLRNKESGRKNFDIKTLLYGFNRRVTNQPNSIKEFMSQLGIEVEFYVRNTIAESVTFETKRKSIGSI